MNPILPGFNPDPSICRVGNDYFLATSTFEYFPGVAISHSTDLINWRPLGHALNRRSQLDMRCVEPGAGVWAPTLRYWKGRFYMATCVVYSRTQRPEGFYVYTDNIFDETTWSEPIFFDQVGIDQDLFFDDDDRVYLCTARFSRGPRQPTGTKLVIYGVEIDLATGRSLCAPVLLRSSPPEERVSEGPHILKRNGMYYLFTAEGGTGPGHHVIVTRSTHPLGPYDLPVESGINPAVFNGNDQTVRRTGHTDLVEGADGRWWAVLLAVRPQGGEMFQLGRETFLIPVTWGKDGWPRFNNGELVSTTIQADMPESKRPTTWRDDFKSSELSPGWYHLRTPIRPIHSLNSSTAAGGLTLHGNAHTIQQYESPAILLRKQTSYSGTWTTVLDFQPAHAYEEAGTTVMYSANSFAALVVRQKAGQGQEGNREVVLRWTDPVHRDVKEIRRDIPQKGPISISITAQPKSYSFSYSIASESKITLSTLPSKILDGGSDQEYEFFFTGAHFGLFAQGTDGEACTTPAHFQYAEYVEQH